MYISSFIITMPFLLPDHIIDLYCFVDNHVKALPPSSRGGRPAILSDSEMITILIWHTLISKPRTVKDLHAAVRLYQRDLFPKLPKYNAFLEQCHRVTPQMYALLHALFCQRALIKILDATMLPVCKLARAEEHKTAQGVAQFGKNWQGWHFGFKLHASIDLRGRLSAIVFTPASTYDGQMTPKLVNEHTRIAVGDTLYGAKVMGKKIWKKFQTVIIAPPFPKQNKKIAAPWQIELLEFRSKIESVFDVLKNHFGLVTSFARSVDGYFMHYARVLLAYQVMAVSVVE